MYHDNHERMTHNLQHDDALCWLEETKEKSKVTISAFTRAHELFHLCELFVIKTFTKNGCLISIESSLGFFNTVQEAKDVSNKNGFSWIGQ